MTNMKEAWEKAQEGKKKFVNNETMKLIKGGESTRKTSNDLNIMTRKRRQEITQKESDVFYKKLISEILFYVKKYALPITLFKDWKYAYIGYRRGSICTLKLVSSICATLNIKPDIASKDPQIQKDLIAIEKDTIQINMQKNLTADKLIMKVFIAKLQYIIAKFKVDNRFSIKELSSVYDIDQKSVNILINPGLAENKRKDMKRDALNFNIRTIVHLLDIANCKVELCLLNGTPIRVNTSLYDEYITRTKIKRISKSRCDTSMLNMDLSPEFYYKSMIPFEERNPDIKFENTILKRTIDKSNDIDNLKDPLKSHTEDIEKNTTNKVGDNNIKSAIDEVSKNTTDSVVTKDDLQILGIVDEVNITIGGVSISVPAKIIERDGKKAISLSIDISLK